MYLLWVTFYRLVLTRNPDVNSLSPMIEIRHLIMTSLVWIANFDEDLLILVKKMTDFLKSDLKSTIKNRFLIKKFANCMMLLILFF